MNQDTTPTTKKKLAAEKLQSLQKTAVKLIKQLTINEKSKKLTSEIKLRTLSDINSHLHQIQRISSLQNQLFADQKLIIFVRHFLVDPSYNNKIPPLEFFRLILVTEAVADKFLAHSIPVYISKVIERDDMSRMKPGLGSNFQQQTFQALRLIKHWIQKFPKKFPQYLAFCLVALAELPVATSIQQKKKDQIAQHIKTFIIDILLSLSVKNTKLCCISGGFSLLVNSITDPILSDKSYDIISKMLIFMNDVKNRQLTAPYIDFKKIFHVLTDLDNVFLEQSYKTRNNLQSLSKFQSKLGLAKNAIVTLLKSWVGLIIIGNDPSSINALLQTLKQIPKKYDSQLRNIIFEALQQIISVGDNVMTASTAQQKHSFKISNLIGCYLMTVIEMLIEQNLLRILIQLSGVQQSFVSQPSQRLLKKLTLLIFNYRPESSKYIDFLITAANKSTNINNQMLKTSSSFVINKIGNYIYDRKQKKNHPMFNQLQNLFSLKSIYVPHSRASLNSISKTLNFISYKQKNQYRKNLLQKDPISKQHKQNYVKWKWDIIQNLLQFPDPDKFKPSTNQRYRQNKMYKYLLRFFSPSRGNFYKLDWHMSNFIYVKVGMLLIKNSITIPQNLPLIKNPPESQFQCTVSFIGDLQKLLQININQCIKNSEQWDIVLCTKLQRQLMSFIGLFSETKVGYESLICENRFLQLLQGCLVRQQCSHLVYLILINFDFYRDDINKITLKNPQNGAINLLFLPTTAQIPTNLANHVVSSVKIGLRSLLQSCIKQGSHCLKLACVQILKILLKTQVHLFSVFSYKLLIHVLQCEPQGQEIVKVVVQFLQENLTNKNNVETFLKVLTDLIVDFNPKSQMPLVKTNSDSSQGNMNNSQQKSPDKKNNIKQQKNPDTQQDFQKNFSFFSQNSKNLFGPDESYKLKFEQIKQKLSTPIIIRLLSYESGIEMLQKYFPDWLQQEYAKWISSDHSYCTSLQNKLNGALNFAKKKEKGYYKITSNSHVYDLLFMYKLPWILHANQNKFPLWIRQKGQSYQFYVDFSAGKQQSNHDHPKFLISNDNLKIMIGIGTMLLDQEFNVITNSQNNSHLTIFLTMNSKPVTLYGMKLQMVQSNGVEVYYRKYDSGFDKNTLKDKKTQMSQQEEWEYYNSHVQDLNKLQIVRIVINVKLPSVQHTQELPLHLINQLIKTKRGREFLQQKKYVDKAASVLRDFIGGQVPGPSVLEVRSTLWSLGFFGSRNQGIKILQKKKVFDDIIGMTYNSPILSLRGTCRYILNMFSHSQFGRNILIQRGFNVNSRCFTSYPADVKKFYSISWSPFSKRLFILDDRYWQTYNALQQPMTKNEQKLFQLISLLINSLSFKSAVTQIRQVLKISPKIAISVNLLHNVINLLTFFKYKHESRKSIMNIFDQLIKSPDFNNDIPDKITFFLNQQETQRKLSIQLLPKSSSNLDQYKQIETNDQVIKTEQVLK